MLGRGWYSPFLTPVHIYRITVSIRLEKTSEIESNLWTKHPHVKQNMAQSATCSLKQLGMLPACIQSCKVCHRALCVPWKPLWCHVWIIQFFQSNLTHPCLYILQIPVFHPSFILHWLILVFSWLTITDVGELLQYRERASFWSGVIIIYSHYNIECACVKPDPVDDSFQENVGIWFYF